MNNIENSIDSLKIINQNLEEDKESITEDVILIPDDIIIGTHIDPTLIYQKLIDELYDIVGNNKELFDNKNTNISKPDVKYENRKTFWLNFGKNCNQLNRTVNQLKKYIDKEYGIETSINEKNQLILRGKYVFNLIASVYKKYIKNYVQCSTCKSFNTEIIRNSSTRLDYLKCLNQKCNTCKAVIKI